jgi:hypothetical protein
MTLNFTLLLENRIYIWSYLFETTITHNNKRLGTKWNPKVALLNTLYAIYGLATSDKDPDTFY